jgi:hypothetical protein
MSEVKFREQRNSPPMVINFAKAVLRATVKPGSNPTLPDVGLRLNDVSLDEKHLTAYRKVCGFAADGKLPVTYPHMHAFPSPPWAWYMYATASPSTAPLQNASN